MNRSTLSALAILGLTSTALAADLGATPDVDYAVPPVAVDTFDWSGFYAGVHGGYGWGEADPQNPGTPTQKPEGGFGGFQLGFDYQFANNLVLGAVVDASFGKIDDAVEDGGPYLIESGEIESFGTLRLRAGYAMNRFLPYVTGGVAWAHGKGKIECLAGAPLPSVCNALGAVSESDSSTSTGWVAGIGFEYAFTDRWTVNFEYLYADLGSTSMDFGIFGDGEFDSTLNTVKAGLNYRF